MSKIALIRLGRVYAGETEIPQGQTRYGHRMRLAPWVERVPLLIDHDEGKRVGTVLALDEFDDTDGRWVYARCRMYADAPAWVKRGSRASWSYKVADRSTFVDGYIYGGCVDEVSLLHELTPAEPGAQLILLRDVAPEPEPEPEGEIIHHHGERLVRGFDHAIIGVR
jgi:hypothetical protein